jgi:hypothetical protein
VPVATLSLGDTEVVETTLELKLGRASLLDEDAENEGEALVDTDAESEGVGGLLRVRGSVPPDDAET